MKNEKKGSKNTEWKEIKVRMKNENKGRTKIREVRMKNERR